MTWRKTLGDHLRQRLAEVELRPGEADTPEMTAVLCDAVNIVQTNIDALIASTVARAEAGVALIAPADDALRQAIGERIAQHPGLIDWPEPWEPEVRRQWTQSLQELTTSGPLGRRLRDEREKGVRAEREKWPVEKALSLLDAWARCKGGDRTTWMAIHERGTTSGRAYSLALDAVPKDRLDDARDLVVCRWREGRAINVNVNVNDLTNLHVWLAWQWWTETQPERLAHHAASGILDSIDDELARGPKALTALSRAVLDELGNAPTWREDVGDDVEGVYPLDEELAAFLTRIGGAGRKLSGEVREASKGKAHDANAKRWEPDTEPLRVARLLARALWFDVVAPRLQRLESTHPALARVVHIDVVGILRPGLSIRDDYVVDTDGRQRMMFTQSQALDVPTVEMGALPRLLSRGLELFGSIQVHRIVRHVVKEGHRRAITGEADPRVLRYQGGWSALAAQANVTEADDARAIVVALAHAAHELTDGTHGNLLAYTARRGAPGRPGLVSLTLGDMLLPHFVHSLNQSKARTPTENRRLVPIVDFAGFVGRNNDHAAQATLQMMFMARLRDAASELAATGTVRITDVEFAALAHDAGLIPGLLPRVIDRWTHHGGDAPAFMVKEGDRYTLAPHFAPALAFLEAAGRISLERSKAGKLSAARKGKPRRKKPAAS